MIILTDDDPILRQVSEPVSTFDGELVVWCDALVETMKKANGAGISAPQVGVSKRIIVITDTCGEPIVMINPKMVDHSTKLFTMEEGCLSLPGRCVDVVRPFIVKVEYQDTSGHKLKQELDFWASRVFQHELDHLNGVLMTDRRENVC